MSQAPDPPASELIAGDASVELSSNRTSLSLERTWMSADRTLMSMVSTSLSLISFGFTIHEAFRNLPGLAEAGRPGRLLGGALLFLGVALLVMGILGHAAFGRELSQRRERLWGLHLLRRMTPYRLTPTYVIAVLLLIVGLIAMAAITFRLLG